MALGPHGAFIVAAYLVTAVVMLGLIVWVIADRRAQTRALAELDARGVRRRSEPAQARTA